MAGTLYIAATPLGNLDDITKRLLDVLTKVDVVYAEDTRRSRILLQHMGTKKELRSLHGHNEVHRIGEVLGHLEEGRDVAVLTDAGTPAVSDPGSDVVAAAHEAGHRVAPLVGPSALAAALSVAGFTGPGVSVLFLGFLPTKGKEHKDAWAQVLAHRGVVVLFEAPNRLAKTLAHLAEHEPQRLVCVCREMTKVYEEVRRAPAAAMAEWAASKEVLGEITLVIGPTTQEERGADETAIAAAIERCMAAGLSARDTATAVAAVLGVPKRQVYAMCVQR